VIVAHRLSTIRQCDNIVVLNDGSISEEGNFDELVDKKGVFYDLVKNQM
jgi:ABC-type multidrug transport system fused ATPase/permease subunit